MAFWGVGRVRGWAPKIYPPKNHSQSQTPAGNTFIVPMLVVERVPNPEKEETRNVSDVSKGPVFFL